MLMLQIRSFHRIPPTRNLLSWFKKKDAKPLTSTQELIKAIESNEKIEESVINKLDLSDANNIIGKHIIKPVSLNLLPFNHWLSEKKLTTEAELDRFINQIAKDLELKIDESFPDILTRFKFYKKIQILTGYTISDYQLTILNSPVQFKNYYMENIISGKLLRYNVKEPNAIHISTEQYNLPNVIVKEPRPPKEQKVILNSILNEVKYLKEAKIQQAINELKAD